MGFAKPAKHTTHYILKSFGLFHPQIWLHSLKLIKEPLGMRILQNLKQSDRGPQTEATLPSNRIHYSTGKTQQA